MYIGIHVLLLLPRGVRVRVGARRRSLLSIARLIELFVVVVVVRRPATWGVDHRALMF
jgi:hypothetical protein